MSIILSPNETLYLQTSAPSTTVRLHISYVDIGTNVTGASTQVSANGSVNTSILASPGSDAKRCIKNLFIGNGSATINMRLSISSSTGGLFTLYNARLGNGHTLAWTDGLGWQRDDSRGCMVTEPARISDTQTYSTPGTYTWTKPTSFTPRSVYVLMWGGGGGGGGGYSAAAGTNRLGGGGGGGGAFNYRIFPASDLPSTVTVTVGSGGLGGVGGNAAGLATTGSAGEVSSFGDYLFAFGGGGVLRERRATAVVAVVVGYSPRVLSAPTTTPREAKAEPPPPTPWAWVGIRPTGRVIYRDRRIFWAPSWAVGAAVPTP